LVAVCGILAVVFDGGLGAPVGTATASPTVTTAPTTTATTLPPTTAAPTTLPVTAPPPPPTEPPPPAPDPLAAGAVAPVGVVRTPSGIVAPVLADLGGGLYDVQTPCDARATVAGTPVGPIDIVLDPGHGGEEPGAVGPNGLQEKDVNLAVAQQVADRLRAAGLRVLLTREFDVRLTLAHRANVATALGATFLSIHHNAVADGPSAGPGTEVYYQIANPESLRLAGLVVDEVRAALAPFGVAWASDAENGAKARVRASDGADYYGVLRRTAGVTGVLSEAGYLSNPPEADLFATAEGQAAEAGAIARAVLRWYAGEGAGGAADASSPPSTAASGGGGGGTEGCIDPALG
jgi:N-acetylmuramoyl-L-alanine amidase